LTVPTRRSSDLTPHYNGKTFNFLIKLSIDKVINRLFSRNFTALTKSVYHPFLLSCIIGNGKQGYLWQKSCTLLLSWHFSIHLFNYLLLHHMHLNYVLHIHQHAAL